MGTVDGVEFGRCAEELGAGGLVMEEADVTIQALNALVNILIAGAAISGVVIAAMGLSTYKHQAQWSEERDLARKLLIKLKFREDGFGLVPFAFRSLNSFMRPFARMPRGFCRLMMSGGGAGYRTH